MSGFMVEEGGFLVTDTGFSVDSDDCCICDHCLPGEHNLRFKIVFSGIALCMDCYAYVDVSFENSRQFTTTPSSPNQTIVVRNKVTLFQSTYLCWCIGTVSATGVIKIYPDPNCEGTPTVHTITSLQAILIIRSTYYELYLTYYSDAGVGVPLVFYGTLAHTSGTTCDGGTIDNDFTTCAWNAMGINGSAVVSVLADTTPQYKLDPCNVLGNDCSRCDDYGDGSNTTPSEIDVTLSDFVWCSDCFHYTTRFKWANDPWPTVNGTRTLYQTSSPCVWDCVFASGGSLDFYELAECGGDVSYTYTFTQIRITVTKMTSTTMRIRVVGEDSGDAEILELYNEVATVTAGECYDVYCSEKENTDCEYGPSEYSTQGHTGAATATVVGPGRQGRCGPSALAYYTNTDLSEYLGKIVEISQSEGQCYIVQDNTELEDVDGEATVLHYWNFCVECCMEHDPC